MVREYWTDSHCGLVVEGNPEIIRAIARALRMPVDASIAVSASRSVLGLWGESVRAYQDLPVSSICSQFSRPVLLSAG